MLTFNVTYNNSAMIFKLHALDRTVIRDDYFSNIKVSYEIGVLDKINL
jgi:hypothetical protein